MAKLKTVRRTYTKRGTHTLDCMICKTGVTTDKSTHAVVCGSCVARVIPAPVQKPTIKVPKLTKSGKPRAKRGTAVKKVPSGFPRGWHFKLLYIHKDGQAYSRGKPVTPKGVAALKRKLGMKS